jgi:hypothetical protein
MSTPVSFPPSPLFQSGTASYSTHSSNQDANQSSASSTAASSDSSQRVPASSTDDSQPVRASTDDSGSVQAPSSSQEPENSTAAQKSAGNGATTDQSGKKNPSPASIGAAPPVQSTLTDDSHSPAIADAASANPVSANQGRSPSAPSTAAQQTIAVGTKAGETGRQEVSKHQRKANEAGKAGGAPGEAQGDSVAATLLAVANASATTPATAGPNTAAPSDPAAALAMANKNNLAAPSNSPNALAFAVKLQSTNSALGGPALEGSATANAAAIPGAAPPTGASAGDQGLSKFAEQLQAVTGAAQLAQEPASLQGGAPASMPATTDFATATSRESAPSSSSTGTNSPQITETEGAAADDVSSPAPLRSMQVQINGRDNQRVDLRLVERAGTLSMSVRSLDGTLNRNLQDHLPELITKLADQPGEAEWWTPKTQTAEGGSGSGTGGGSKEDSSASQGQQNQTGADSGRQQGGRQSNQPRWVEELAALGNSNTTKKETIWHQ